MADDNLPASGYYESDESNAAQNYSNLPSSGYYESDEAAMAASANAGGSADFATSVRNGANWISDKVSSAISSFDPSKARLSLAGLLGGSAKTVNPSLIWASGLGQHKGDAANDWRVRVSVAAGSKVLYDNESAKLLSPLKATGGVVFPVTPNLQITHLAKYSSSSLTHSNFAMHSYEGSEVSSIMINGEFPIQNIVEGQYLLAAIYFFRAATKMYWGDEPKGSIPAGTPPPMVFLSGYGQDYFPNVPCVVTQFMHSLPDQVDYIEIPRVSGADGHSTRLPTLSQLQVTLQPIYSRKALRDFSADAFMKGKLINRGFM